MRVVVTGGAGYIGSVVTAELCNRGHEVLVVDDLSAGHLAAVDRRASFEKCSIGDTQQLDRVFGKYRPEAVIHLAALSNIEVCSRDAAACFRVNVTFGVSLLNTMLKHGIRDLVFSSSAAVYGEPESLSIHEEHATNPVNSYGSSKLAFEGILRQYAVASGLRYVALRYFNAAGATLNLGEAHPEESHLIPKVLRVALGQEPEIAVFGSDYDTLDGTCIRDYVHVVDIARAHILALERIEILGCQTYNLGNESGYSVLEIVDVARRLTGLPIPTRAASRRQGDPARLVADSSRIARALSWHPTCSDIESIVSSAWMWHKSHPRGYRHENVDRCSR